VDYRILGAAMYALGHKRDHCLKSEALLESSYDFSGLLPRTNEDLISIGQLAIYLISLSFGSLHPSRSICQFTNRVNKLG
jgi:hypothetical protein